MWCGAALCSITTALCCCDTDICGVWYGIPETLEHACLVSITCAILYTHDKPTRNTLSLVRVGPKRVNRTGIVVSRMFWGLLFCTRFRWCPHTARQKQVLASAITTVSRQTANRSMLLWVSRTKSGRNPKNLGRQRADARLFAGKS